MRQFLLANEKGDALVRQSLKPRTRPLIIWHSPLMSTAPDGGVNHSVARLARASAQQGVRVVVLSPHQDADVRITNNTEVPTLFEARLPLVAGRFPAHALEAVAKELPPSLVHIHSAFQFHNSWVARWAGSVGVPYAVHHRGALAAPLLERRWVRKRIYLAAVERSVLGRAALALGNTQGDVEDLMRVVPGFPGRTAVVPNPVVDDGDLEVLKELDPSVDSRQPTQPYSLIYLGRWDVVHKGLDRLAAVAASAPDVTIDIHTALRPKKELRLARRLIDSLPPNMSVCEPVVKRDKWRKLAAADAYVHLARWESFGVAVVEGAAAGLPLVLTPEMHLAIELEQAGAAIIVDGDDPDHVRGRLFELLEDDEALMRMREAGRHFAREHCHEDRVALEMISAYRSVL